MMNFRFQFCYHIFILGSLARDDLDTTMLFMVVSPFRTGYQLRARNWSETPCIEFYGGKHHLCVYHSC